MTPQPPANPSLNQRLDVEFALQAAGLGVWELDLSTNIVHWDDTCQALFGLASDNKLPYAQVIQYIHPDDLERVEQAVQQAMKPLTDGHYDVTYRTIGAHDQQLRWVRFSGRAYFSPQGQVYRFAGTAQNVTQQVEDKQVLEASTVELERRQVALQSAQVGTWTLDIRQQQVWWDQTCKVLYGFDRNDVVPYAQVLSYIHPDDRLRVNTAVQWALNPQSGGGYECQFRTLGAKDGRLRWLQCRGQALFDEQGVAYRFSGIAQEVTQQVAARQQFLQAQQQAFAVLERLPVAIGICILEGPEFIIRTANPFYGELIGQSVADVLGRSAIAVRPELVEQGYFELMSRVMTTGQDVARTEVPVQVVRQAKTETIYVNFVYTPHYQLDETITGVIALMIDVTALVHSRQAVEKSEARYRQLSQTLEEQVQQRTQELAESNADLITSVSDLQRSNANLQQFAYVASHDLQEPLRKIQSFSTLLGQQLDEHIDETSRSHLQRITAAGARMSTLIKDLLAYSRIATRQQAFGLVSLQTIMEGVLSVLDWEIQRSQAQIQVDALPVVNGDDSQLSQLFQNLLTNALKFVIPGQKPQIHIGYVYRPLAELPADVRPSKQVAFYHQISVHDKGVGFDEKYRERIFEVFQRLHGRHEYAGTGVGLAIVQRVVENHGGGITANSQPGEGATFCVYLPA